MEPEKKTGFDATKPLVVPILSGGEKSCEVRFPTDEEWCAWARAQRTVRHFLGRRKSYSEDVDLPKINAELFAKIRTDKDGSEFDDAEAGMVIGRIERCAVASVEREGINYRIEMKVPGTRVVHVLRMPTAKEMQDHERASTTVVAAEAERPAPHRRPVDKKNYPPRMVRLQDALTGPVKDASLLLMAGVVLILLIACTSVANLLMARPSDRGVEISIRSALGASRARLSQQLLTESLFLSLVASCAGLLVAHSIASLAASVQPAPVAAEAYSILNARVLGFAMAVSILTGLLFGVLPSLYAGRVHVFGARSSTVRLGARAVGEVLIGVQIMLTIVLLASSLSIGRAFLHVMHADRGFDMQGIVTVNVSLAGTKAEIGEHPLEYFEGAVARVREVPGVRAASVTDFLPLIESPLIGAPTVVDGRRAQKFSMIVPVLPDYLQTMGGHLLQGREFSDSEVRADARVAIINQTLADEFGGPSEVLGHELRAGRDPMKIIGVVKDMVYLGDYNPDQIFVPDHSPGRSWVTIVARVNGRAEDHLAMIRDAVKSVDPDVPVFAVKTMEERLADALARPKFYSVAVIFFAAFALLLAVIGIYGIVSYTVSRRAHEMGVRLALGTTPGHLRATMLTQGLITVAAGPIPGVVGTVLAGRFLASLVDGAKSASASTCLISLLFIGLVASAGVWIATRRIARLNIVEVLRSE